MSDGRKRLSGSAYRRRALDKNKKENEILCKTPKLEDFFTKKEGTEDKQPVNKDCMNSEQGGMAQQCC